MGDAQFHLLDRGRALDAEVDNEKSVYRLRLGGAPITTKAATVAGSGDNTFHTPASGKQIRLEYVSLSADAANSSAVTATVKLAGGDRYKVSLLPGAIWARNIGAGKRHVLGATDQPLVVNLSAAQSVHVSIEYDEVT
jgi:hypothetical protein